MPVLGPENVELDRVDPDLDRLLERGDGVARDQRIGTLVTYSKHVPTLRNPTHLGSSCRYLHQAEPAQPFMNRVGGRVVHGGGAELADLLILPARPTYSSFDAFDASDRAGVGRGGHHRVGPEGRRDDPVAVDR